jgi:hypothetical protein
MAKKSFGSSHLYGKLIQSGLKNKHKLSQKVTDEHHQSADVILGEDDSDLRHKKGKNVTQK